jgi:hypothetical protein
VPKEHAEIDHRERLEEIDPREVDQGWELQVVHPRTQLVHVLKHQAGHSVTCAPSLPQRTTPGEVGPTRPASPATSPTDPDGRHAACRGAVASLERLHETVERLAALRPPVDDLEHWVTRLEAKGAG